MQCSVLSPQFTRDYMVDGDLMLRWCRSCTGGLGDISFRYLLYLLRGLTVGFDFGSFVTKFDNRVQALLSQQITSNKFYIKSFRFLPVGCTPEARVLSAYQFFNGFY